MLLSLYNWYDAISLPRNINGLKIGSDVVKLSKEPRIVIQLHTALSTDIAVLKDCEPASFNR